MKITYDKTADAAYVKINEGKIARTEKIDEQILCDKDQYGQIVGIEILGKGEVAFENNSKKVKSAQNS